MTRASRSWSIGLFAVVLTGFLACCVNFTKDVEFTLESSGGRTTLDVYVSRLGVRHFNPHASNSDTYSFILPAGQAHVSANQISQYFVNYKEQAPAFADSGGIDLKVNAGCEIRIDLTEADGRPSPANGTHREGLCGMKKL